MRYQQLIPIIAHNKPETIVEVGTWNGDGAIMMATEALKHQEKVEYYGFDFFEDASDETDARELNVKKHFSMKAVIEKLEAFRAENPGFTFRLQRGDTCKTVAEFRIKPDLAFIDGGHSIETIRSDFDNLRGAKALVLDDYYEKDGQGRSPDIGKFGCNFLIDGNPDHVILPQGDPVMGGGLVKMLALPRSAWPGKMNLVIKTKNCVPDEEIQSNVRYSLERMPRWISQCRPHGGLGVMVSAGPGMKDYLDDIRNTQGYVVCVKHAHDVLISEGIIPDACMLLDPRSHVQDFIENPHPDVTYFVASMCHPTTLDRLLERNARVFGYHALVGAGEDKTIPKGHIMIGGGSTSAVRGVSVLHGMGFRRFELYGYDSCYYEQPDMTVKTKTGALKYMKVEVAGKKFYTDAELLAQAQDFETLVKQGVDLDINVIGDGIVPHIWSKAYRRLPKFEEMMVA